MLSVLPSSVRCPSRPRLALVAGALLPVLWGPAPVLAAPAVPAPSASSSASSFPIPPRPAASGTMIEPQKVTVPAALVPARGKADRPSGVEEGAIQNLAVGEVSTLQLRGVARIAIGNGALIKATVVDDRQVVLLAEEAGDTNMHVWLRNGRQVSYPVHVETVRTGRVMADLKTLLSETPGITARQVGDRIVMEGRYPNSETAARLKLLAGSFPQVLNLVPERPADADPLQMDRMVLIDLRVIEVKKRALDQLGIKWSSSAAGPTFATNVLGYANTTWRPGTADGYPTVTTSNPALSYFGLATQITSAINMLEQNGDAWTLAEPKLSCRSGAESNFLAGGEIPIPVAQALGVVSVEYKQYGVKINFKPVADGNGNIDSNVMVEVSEPDTRNSNNGYVAFTTNRTETQLALKAGEPMVIAGLLRQKSERGSDGVPGLSRLPLISGLFKSREHTNEQTELFIIATPRVITPESVLNRDAVDRAAAQAQASRDRASPRLDPSPAQGEFGATGD